MSQPSGRLAGQQHGAELLPAQCPDIQIQPGTDGGHFLRLIFILRHNRAGPAGQQKIRHVVRRHIICHVVDQRSRTPHPVQICSKHIVTLPCMAPRIPFPAAPPKNSTIFVASYDTKGMEELQPYKMEPFRPKNFLFFEIWTTETGKFSI